MIGKHPSLRPPPPKMNPYQSSCFHPYFLFGWKAEIRNPKSLPVAPRILSPDSSMSTGISFTCIQIFAETLESFAQLRCICSPKHELSVWAKPTKILQSISTGLAASKVKQALICTNYIVSHSALIVSRVGVHAIRPDK